MKFQPVRFAFEIVDLLIKVGAMVNKSKEGGWRRSEVLALIRAAAAESLDVMEAGGVVFAPEPDPEDDEDRAEREARVLSRALAISPRILARVRPAPSPTVPASAVIVDGEG